MLEDVHLQVYKVPTLINMNNQLDQVQSKYFRDNTHDLSQCLARHKDLPYSRY